MLHWNTVAALYVYWTYLVWLCGSQSQQEYDEGDLHHGSTHDASNQNASKTAKTLFWTQTRTALLCTYFFKVQTLFSLSPVSTTVCDKTPTRISKSVIYQKSSSFCGSSCLHWGSNLCTLSGLWSHGCLFISDRKFCFMSWQ